MSRIPSDLRVRTLRHVDLSDILSDMSEDAQTYGERLKAERDRCGWSLEETMFRTRMALGKPISAKTIQRLENGTTSEAAADERLVVTLCRLYEVEPRKISPAIADRAELLMAVLAGGPPPDDQDIAGNGDASLRYAQMVSDLPVRSAA